MIHPNEEYETIIKIISPVIDDFILEWYKSKKGTFKRGDDIQGQLRYYLKEVGLFGNSIIEYKLNEYRKGDMFNLDYFGGRTRRTRDPRGLRLSLRVRPSVRPSVRPPNKYLLV